MTLGFGGQLSSRKGEVQWFCYRLPACWHYRSSLPLCLTLPVDHLVLLHSTRLLPAFLKGQQHISTSTTLFSLVSLGFGPQLLPSRSRLLTKTSRLSSEQQPKGCHQHGRLRLNSKSHFLYSSAHFPLHRHSVYSEAILCVHKHGRPRSPGSSLNPQ